MTGLLSRLGDAGLSAPMFMICLGLLVPPLAAFWHALLVPCVVMILAGSVCLVETGPLRWRELVPAALLAVSNLLLTPAVVHLAVRALDLGEIGGWLVLVAACPAAGAAALVAGLLRLPVRPILLAQLLCFFALPLTVPLVAGLVLQGSTADPWDLLERVTFIVGLPALLGFVLRRLLGEARRARLFRPIRGAGALALCGLGLAVTDGLAPGLAYQSQTHAMLFGLVFVSGVGGGLGLALGLALGPATGARIGGAFAMGGAVRNVSLMWSATLGMTSPEADLLLQLGALWALSLPALFGIGDWLPALLHRYGRVAAVAVGMLMLR